MQRKQREAKNKVQTVFVEVNVNVCESQCAAGSMACQQFLFNNISRLREDVSIGGI